jgi:hypothetical protein
MKKVFSFFSCVMCYAKRERKREKKNDWKSNFHYVQEMITEQRENLRAVKAYQKLERHAALRKEIETFQCNFLFLEYCKNRACF